MSWQPKEQKLDSGCWALTPSVGGVGGFQSWACNKVGGLRMGTCAPPGMEGPPWVLGATAGSLGRAGANPPLPNG